MVRSDMKGIGLGYRLMQQMIDYARAAGIQQVFADVLRENHAMRDMAKEFGFIVQPGRDEVDTVTVALKL